MRTDDQRCATPLDRWSTFFLATMATLTLVLTVVSIWAVIRLVLHHT